MKNPNYKSKCKICNTVVKFNILIDPMARIKHLYKEHKLLTVVNPYFEKLENDE